LNSCTNLDHPRVSVKSYALTVRAHWRSSNKNVKKLENGLRTVYKAIP